MENQNEKSVSLKTQSAWLLFAKITGFAISFMLPILIVRFLTQEEVGVYRKVFLVIVTANAILPLGFGMSAFYFLSRETVRRGAVIFNTLLFNFAVGAIACFTLYFYPQLLGNLFQSEEMTRLAPKIGVVIWVWIFSTFLETVAIANQEARIATAFIVLAQLTKTILMVFAVMIFANVDSFLYAAMIQAFLQSIVLLVYLNSRFPNFWKAFDPGFFREQLFYALPFGLAGLLWTLQTDVHNFFVGYRFSSAEFAIYAYGCFELPLIAMLMESVTAVLIPRMSQLQAKNDKAEMIRLLSRTMQKLAFFYFPIYVFLMITAETFITTLFTRNYLASVPIFMINLTLLPFYILVTDPIVRAYKELGRFLLTMRIFIIFGLISALYFGIQRFNLSGMIAIVVVAALIERLISSAVVFKKLDVSARDLFMLSGIGKTALSSLTAGFFTYIFYYEFNSLIFAGAADFTRNILSFTKDGFIDFLSGGLVLAACGFVFLPIYLLTANFFGIVEDEEKDKAKQIYRKIFRRSDLPLTTDK